MITYYPLLPARPHDIQFLEELVENFSGAVPADKGFIDALRQALLQEGQGVTVITPARKNMTETLPFQLRRLCQRWRKRIETVGSQLTERLPLNGSGCGTFGIFNIVSFAKSWLTPLAFFLICS